MSDIEMESKPPVVEIAEQNRLKIQGDQQNATFSFYDEDHTLGNLLRNQIVKNPYVEFCAYSVPHPSEPICNLRIQCAEAAEGTTDANRVLKAGLKRVSKVCDVLNEKFESRLVEFKAKQKKQ